MHGVQRKAFRRNLRVMLPSIMFCRGSKIIYTIQYNHRYNNLLYIDNRVNNYPLEDGGLNVSLSTESLITNEETFLQEFLVILKHLLRYNIHSDIFSKIKHSTIYCDLCIKCLFADLLINLPK